MKIVFCQKDSFVWLAPAHLASVLSAQGHVCRVLIESHVERITDKVQRLSPDLVAFSLTTGLEGWATEAIHALKNRLSIPIIVGGPHPTYFPEFIEQAPIDALCRGEAEEAIRAYVEGLSGNADVSTAIPNLWLSTESGIVRNDVTVLTSDLNRYPIPDVGIYFDAYPHLGRFYRHLYPVVSGRGCPLSCTYCFNKAFRELYRGKGHLVRRRRFEHLSEELLHARDKYSITQVYFQDDTFLDPMSWFREFIERYPSEVGLPYFCLVRAESVNDDIARALAGSGCVGVTIGVETGSETIRRDVLGKRVSNDRIIQAVRMLHDQRITVQTDMILGLPGQDLEGALESLRFVKKIESDFAWCSLLQPYPGTEIFHTVQSLAQQAGSGWAFTANGIPASYFEDSALDFPNKRKIVRLQKLFQTFHRLKVSEPWIQRILALPLDQLFNIMHSISFNLSVRRIKRIPWPVFLREALRRLPGVLRSR